MQKKKQIIKSILIVILLLFILILLRILTLLGIVSITFLIPEKKISGIENYDKSYFIKEYGGDLDSNLSIFPDNISKLVDASFNSSFQTNLFDSDGYILLKSKYNYEDFVLEIERIKNLSIIISNGCNKNADTYKNIIKYDENSYKYPAYVTIDGFGNTYEYALINENELEIIYVYLSYPTNNNSIYSNYLKIDKSEYSKDEIKNAFSMYNHSFDNGMSYLEFDDCK